mmetsp:Transcript_16297/g.26912  ORF Transcript_16297/g.26912 Transcript_16297/m.26912 type:complete len:452 (-) Transcript_16297:181-1536(-)
MSETSGSSRKRPRPVSPCDDTKWVLLACKGKAWASECQAFCKSLPSELVPKFRELLEKIIAGKSSTGCEKEPNRREEAHTKKAKEKKETVNQDKIAYVMGPVTAVSPRGKWNLTFTGDSNLIMELKEKRVVVEATNLKRIITVPDNNGLYIYVGLQLRDPVTLGKSKYGIVLFKLHVKSNPKVEWGEATPKLPQSVQKLKSEKKSAAEILAMSWKVPIERANKTYFASSSSKHAIACTVKANSGALYPLRGGIFYIGKPLVFLPRKEIEEIKAARGGTIGSYFDLCVEHDGTLYEFGMINKSEQGPIQGYVQSLQELRSADERRSQKKKNKKRTDDSDDDAGEDGSREKCGEHEDDGENEEEEEEDGDDDDADDSNDSDYVADDEERPCADEFESDDENLRKMDQEFGSDSEAEFDKDKWNKICDVDSPRGENTPAMTARASKNGSDTESC